MDFLSLRWESLLFLCPVLILHVTQGQPSFCLLEVDRGPCSATLSLYYYDSVSNQCEVFTYGGCLGNSNQFESLDECRRTCVLGGFSTSRHVVFSTSRPSDSDGDTSILYAVLVPVLFVVLSVIMAVLVILRFKCKRIYFDAQDRADARFGQAVLQRLRQQASLARAANSNAITAERTTTVASTSGAASASDTTSGTAMPAQLSSTVSLSNHVVEPSDPTVTEAPPPEYNLAILYPSVDDSVNNQPPPPYS